jgi:hypothetical protein
MRTSGSPKTAPACQNKNAPETRRLPGALMLHSGRCYFAHRQLGRLPRVKKAKRARKLKARSRPGLDATLTLPVASALRRDGYCSLHARSGRHSLAPSECHAKSGPPARAAHRRSSFRGPKSAVRRGARSALPDRLAPRQTARRREPHPGPPQRCFWRAHFTLSRSLGSACAGVAPATSPLRT